MPKNRINNRENNLASVGIEKAEADAIATNGIFFMFTYHDKETRKGNKVSVDQNNLLIYEINNTPVASGKYMYAVGKNGALYMGLARDVTVHSQFKAGKSTQSAGWIDYNIEKQSFIVDNCSGHYTPTLSQFLSTVSGLHRAKILPDHFELKLSKFTGIDYNTNEIFWKEVIKDSNHKHEETDLVNVEFDKGANGFVFVRKNGESVPMTREEISQNDHKSHSPKM